MWMIQMSKEYYKRVMEDWRKNPHTMPITDNMPRRNTFESLSEQLFGVDLGW